MTKFLDFLADWHILFIILSLVLIFALIGYFVEKKRHKGSPFKIASEQNKIDEFNMDNLKQMSGSVSLTEAVNKNADIKNNNSNVQ